MKKKRRSVWRIFTAVSVTARLWAENSCAASNTPPTDPVIHTVTASHPPNTAQGSPLSRVVILFPSTSPWLLMGIPDLVECRKCLGTQCASTRLHRRAKANIFNGNCAQL